MRVAGRRWRSFTSLALPSSISPSLHAIRAAGLFGTGHRAEFVGRWPRRLPCTLFSCTSPSTCGRSRRSTGSDAFVAVTGVQLDNGSSTLFVEVFAGAEGGEGGGELARPFQARCSGVRKRDGARGARFRDCEGDRRRAADCTG